MVVRKKAQEGELAGSRSAPVAPSPRLVGCCVCVWGVVGGARVILRSVLLLLCVEAATSGRKSETRGAVV